ncbi:dethiobiotin synthase [Patulibacter minatonensis]|uniref:dethiobiotin synthase n=1 Tax=Patulibacter minatonensis TaxID=298163 RepID=UPI000685724D|nr:dethiobiotin synthase [Patulibacter minatonensis]
MSPALHGVLVTATDTDVGKSVLAAAICARLRADGVDVVAHKSAVTGLDDPAPPHGRDHELLARCTGQDPEEIAPRRYGPAVSPHLAAELAGDQLRLPDLVAAVRAAGTAPDGALRTIVVEGIGGLLVPFDRRGTDVRALAVELGLPLVVAARPGLGTINHVLLTLEAARAVGLEVRGVVLTPWDDGDPLADDNRRTLAESSGVPVDVLPRTAMDPASLARATDGLPVQAWVASAVAR